VRDIASNGGFVDIHHIFPQAWCESRKVSKDDYNCILNKTPLSPPTNVLIGGHAPSIYTKQLEAEARIDADELNGRLATHLIEPVHLRDDKFRPMLDARAKALLDLIDTVTGKKSIRTRSATSKKKWTALDEPTSALRTLAEQPA
jgi:hypothetical protein